MQEPYLLSNMYMVISVRCRDLSLFASAHTYFRCFSFIVSQLLERKRLLQTSITEPRQCPYLVLPLKQLHQVGDPAILRVLSPR